MTALRERSVDHPQHKSVEKQNSPSNSSGCLQDARKVAMLRASVEFYALTFVFEVGPATLPHDSKLACHGRLGLGVELPPAAAKPARAAPAAPAAATPQIHPGMPRLRLNAGSGTIPF